MECVSYKSQISTTLSNVRNTSFQEKNNPISEEDINCFLDALLDFKKDLEQRSELIYGINEKLEKITWFDHKLFDNETLMLLNDLISVAKDLKSSLIRRYVLLDPLRLKGIAKEEIADFKNAIDELKESCEDLESVFFFLPKTPAFANTTKELSLIYKS